MTGWRNHSFRYFNVDSGLDLCHRRHTPLLTQIVFGSTRFFDLDILCSSWNSSDHHIVIYDGKWWIHERAFSLQSLEITRARVLFGGLFVMLYCKPPKVTTLVTFPDRKASQILLKPVNCFYFMSPAKLVWVTISQWAGRVFILNYNLDPSF